MHKEVFPQKPIEIVGVIVLTILMAMANMSGIGGGGIIVSLLMAFFSFSTKEAIPLSGFTILIGAVTRFVVNINQMHPNGMMVSIDYSIAAVMLPTVLIGSLIGVYLNILFPSPILLIILTIVLLLLSIQSGKKAYITYKKENEINKQ